ncbi:hypothetical protein MRX96_026904 [Rhipicephalus microplus]
MAEGRRECPSGAPTAAAKRATTAARIRPGLAALFVPATLNLGTACAGGSTSLGKRATVWGDEWENAERRKKRKKNTLTEQANPQTAVLCPMTSIVPQESAFGDRLPPSRDRQVRMLEEDAGCGGPQQEPPFLSGPITTPFEQRR